MKRGLLILTLILTVFSSCKKEYEKDGPGPVGRTETDIEISLNMPSGSSTRNPVPDNGTYSENNIEELDLLIFKNGKYQYRRPAHRTNALTNSFRATLLVDEDILAIYLLANCRNNIQAWDPTPENETHKGKDWETVAKALVDTDPLSIHTVSSHKPLPMWGKLNKPVKGTGLNQWGKVHVMRSVASADIFVKKGAGTKTSGFKLTDAYLYFAPDRGYLGIRESIYVAGNPFGITGPDSPDGMVTTLRPHSTAVAGDNTADSIAHKLFMYDNTVTDATADKSKNLRFTRMVIGGFYTPEGEPENTTVKSYYPIDFMAADGSFRRVTRNWKYVFNVTGVVGPGYNDPDIAAENYPVDLNVEVIFWNRDHMEIGWDGSNYISIARKYSILPRNAGSTDIIDVCSNMPAEELSLKFDGQPDPSAPYADSIQNDDFIISKMTGSDGTLTGLRIEAKHSYDAAHCTAKIVLKHRVIRYEIDITQKDSDPGDWDLGGDDYNIIG